MTKQQINALYRKMRELKNADESELDNDSPAQLKDWQIIQREGNERIKAEKTAAMRSARQLANERDEAKEKEIQDLFSPESLESLAFEMAHREFCEFYPDYPDDGAPV